MRSQVIHSVRRKFQEPLDLPALDGRKPVEKVIDRAARLQVLDESVHRHARPGKDECATVNVRVTRYELACGHCALMDIPGHRTTSFERHQPCASRCLIDRRASL